MAGDWIKMRPSLLSSPKVNGIARYLEGSPAVFSALSTRLDGKTMYDIVTRNVMRYITVASLLSVWGAANEHTRDGVFRNADLSDLDDIAGVPGFGDAMAQVGWAVYDEVEETVTLPNFNEYNTCGKDRRAESAAERQRKYRQRLKEKAQQSDVTGDVTGDDREEKRREEKKKRKNKQKEIPDDFCLHDGLIAYAKSRGVTDKQYLEDFTEEFITSCKAKGYQYADFDAAWKTWFRKRLKENPAIQPRKRRSLGEHYDS